VVLLKGWIDPMLAWNPSEHGGIETLYLPVDKIWKPDIMLSKLKVNSYVF
jgi:nicotinic acetylcholine receptor alpha-6